MTRASLSSKIHFLSLGGAQSAWLDRMRSSSVVVGRRLTLCEAVWQAPNRCREQKNLVTDFLDLQSMSAPSNNQKNTSIPEHPWTIEGQTSLPRKHALGEFATNHQGFSVAHPQWQASFQWHLRPVNSCESARIIKLFRESQLRATANQNRNAAPAASLLEVLSTLCHWHFENRRFCKIAFGLLP